ncbi:MAG: AAA family ATPase [Cyclobacteriaceae bacterium]|nr:AAA family ATPase [Cyclobacteriaceae bacterium]MCH8516240.1 AAA family ATPase [Cyclobacteriaceae bacterium]
MSDSQEIKERVEQDLKALTAFEREVDKVIIGQQQVRKELLAGMLAGGHGLLEGVPGLAKTLLVKSMAEAAGLSFNRIQFTPDLMPSDILGTEVLHEDAVSKERSFRFVKGPIFANFLLADEINRTPPKTQAALLEAMQEGHVTYGGKKYELPKPFFILATQNPIEQAGTFPLPEAQTDRFLIKTVIDYPTEQEELELYASLAKKQDSISQVLDEEVINRLKERVKEVFVPEEQLSYVHRAVRSTRPESGNEACKRWISWGAGPRAGIAWIRVAQALALVSGSYVVEQSHLDEAMLPVLRHRVRLSMEAEGEGMKIREVLQEVIA